MDHKLLRRALIVAEVVVLILLTLYLKHLSEMRFERSASITGVSLLISLLLLSLYNSRKYLKSPLISNPHVWLALHIAWGYMTLVLFWIHTGTLWPDALYERVLCAIFYITWLSGWTFHTLKKIYHSQMQAKELKSDLPWLTQESIQLKQDAELLAVRSTEETHSQVFADYYTQTFWPHFAKLHFRPEHLFFGKQHLLGLRNTLDNLKHQASSELTPFIEELERLIHRKSHLDWAYTCVGTTQALGVTHLPLTAMLFTWIAWHIGCVLIYAF